MGSQRPACRIIRFWGYPVLWGVLALLGFIPITRVADAADIAQFHLSQARIKPPGITAFLEILDNNDQTVLRIDPKQINASVGGSALNIESIQPFWDLGEGIAYILLVDISKSLTEKEFAKMRAFMNSWINSMTSRDKAAIITFGTEVTLMQDFTADKSGLQTLVAGLSPTDNYTQLHRGLLRAMQEGRRTDPALPVRRAIITLSDGQDDFAGGITKDEVLRDMKVDPVPLYAVGFCRPPITPSKDNSLKTLGEFARTSKGSYFRAQTADFTQIYTAMRNRVYGVYQARMTGPEVIWDGAVRYLKMDLTAGPKVLSDGLDLRMVPEPTSVVVTPPPPPPPPPRPWWKLPDITLFGKLVPWWGYTSAGFLLLGIILALVLILRKKEHLEPAPAAYGGPWQQPGPGVSPVAMANSDDTRALGGDTTIPLQPRGTPKEEKGVKLRFIFIRGDHQPIDATLSKSLIIGRTDGECDVVIKDDKEVSRKHCELFLEDEAVHVIDLGSKNGTMVNGVPITGRYQLKSDDTILVGKTELRLLIL
ncbi:MAG: FHA domain-containing protein [Deltaproteobacteria bacterium]|nr:FHA domain-containing protein [Deltaproteobacteria bacterium]